MQKWEYIRYYVHQSSDGQSYIQLTDRVITGPGILDFINHLGEVGWELISIVPRTGEEILLKLNNTNKLNKKGESASEVFNNVFTGMMIGPVVTRSTQYKTATIGYWLWLKRQKE